DDRDPERGLGLAEVVAGAQLRQGHGNDVEVVAREEVGRAHQPEQLPVPGREQACRAWLPAGRAGHGPASAPGLASALGLASVPGPASAPARAVASSWRIRPASGSSTLGSSSRNPAAFASHGSPARSPPCRSTALANILWPARPTARCHAEPGTSDMATTTQQRAKSASAGPQPAPSQSITTGPRADSSTLSGCRSRCSRTPPSPNGALSPSRTGAAWTYCCSRARLAAWREQS